MRRIRRIVDALAQSVSSSPSACIISSSCALLSWLLRWCRTHFLQRGKTLDFIVDTEALVEDEEEEQAGGGGVDRARVGEEKVGDVGVLGWDSKDGSGDREGEGAVPGGRGVPPAVTAAIKRMEGKAGRAVVLSKQGI